MALRPAGFNFGAGFNPPPLFNNPGDNDYSSIVDSTYSNFAGFNRAYQGMTDQAKLAGETFADRAKENAQNILDNAFAEQQVTSAKATERMLKERAAQIKDNINKDVAQKQRSNTGKLIGTGIGAVAGTALGVGPGIGATVGGGLFEAASSLFG